MKVARVIVEATPDGQLRVIAPGLDPMTCVAMLRFAEHSIIQQQIGPPKQPSNIVIPQVKLPS